MNSIFRLPTKEELDLMYSQLHKKGIGGFCDGSYWSSSETDSTYAWYQYFYHGGQIITTKISTYRIRSVREFESLIEYELRDFGQMGYIFKIQILKSGFKYTEALLWDSVHEETGEFMSWNESMKSKLTRFEIRR